VYGSSFTLEEMFCHSELCGKASMKVYKNGQPIDKVCPFCGTEPLYEITLADYIVMTYYLRNTDEC